ncbi:MAG: adenosylhomocysteinase [Fibrobacteraceae bacterium]|nr:adenosylhomocysteinase [Fibrobacteraceae bacterium]
MTLDEIIEANYCPEEYPALNNCMSRWGYQRPFDGKKVLVATPIYRNTLVQYKTLLMGGAQLFVGNSMPSDEGVVKLLKEWGIAVIKPGDKDEIFDVIFDCGGQFAHFRPKVGFVELTRTGVHFYENSNYPVYVADSGVVKRIETCLGTGDGYIRGLCQWGFSSVEHKKVLVFGAGKVGCGIVVQALGRGAIVNVVTDTHHSVNGVLEANHVTVTDISCIDEVVKKIEEADFVVTATGVKNALDKPELALALLNSKAVVANMGVEDEFGPGVPETRVLNKKVPLNFSLEEPTHLKYIEASLCLHLELGELLLQQNAKQKENVSLQNDAGFVGFKGPMDPPSELENRIIVTTLEHGCIQAELREMMGL